MAPARTNRRALVSVYDKTGIVEFARALHDEFGIEIISTGGTAQTLTDAGLPVTPLEDVTGFAELLGGRVKTLHPKIFAAILADRDNPEHLRQLAEQGIAPIDMVVVNLYPFEKTIADPNCTLEQALEMIDIGGVCLLRAAAKNHRHVLVADDPDHYDVVLSELRRGEGGITPILHEMGANLAFDLTAHYDSAVSRWISQHYYNGKEWFERLRLTRLGGLRYGENPHQSADMYFLPEHRSSNPLVCAARGAHSGVSFNNYADANAALELCAELTRARLFIRNRPPVDQPLGNQPLEDRPLGDRPLGDRPPGDRPLGDRPLGDRPLEDRPPAGLTDQRSVPQGQSLAPQDQPGTSGPGGPGPGGPASGRSITEERFSRRHLPHIEKPEATYFITFRLRRGALAPAERNTALAACKFWHGKKMMLHCACVMPDHVHMILTPFEQHTGRWVPLGELLKSIKNFSSREVNKSRGITGSLWLDENFDRIIRDEADFHEKWDYVFHNPVTAGLVAKPEDYPWFWHSGLGYGELAEVPQPAEEHHQSNTECDRPDDRPEAGPPEAGPTGCSWGTDLWSVRPVIDRPEASPTGCSWGTDLWSVRPVIDRPEAGPTKACCFIKHTNACGVAVETPADDSRGVQSAAQIEAYRRAYLGDPNAAMGAILAVNFNVDAAFATAVMETYQRWGRATDQAVSTGQRPVPQQQRGGPASGRSITGLTDHRLGPQAFFVDVWIAPSFDEDAVRIIRGQDDDGPKKAWGRRVRLLDVGDMSAEPDPGEMDIKSIAGGLLMQTRDTVGLNEEHWNVVTERQPTAAELADLRLAWLVCKHTKSNAISICKDGMLIGNGAGQMSRVMSCRIATWLAKENGHAHKLAGAAVASDGFFPFRDGPDLLSDAGVSALVQPGGGKRDEDVIAACNERGVAMILTGTRHFKH